MFQKKEVTLPRNKGNAYTLFTAFFDAIGI